VYRNHCSWSYLNNTCIPSVQNIATHQFPDGGVAYVTPNDPSVADTCQVTLGFISHLFMIISFNIISFAIET
jgi:hypothetical protein